MADTYFPAGLTIDDKRDMLYVVTKENNSLYFIDLKTKKTIKQLELGGEAYTCKLSPDRNTLFVSCWGCDKVEMFDTKLMKLTCSFCCWRQSQ
ncbi:MAG: hypothetical protein R2771_15085 [Saprospiraceae bacterium]